MSTRVGEQLVEYLLALVFGDLFRDTLDDSLGLDELGRELGQSKDTKTGSLAEDAAAEQVRCTGVLARALSDGA